MRAGALLIAIALSSSATAKTSSKEEKATRKLMHDYARCVVKGQGDRASEAIIANSNNATISKQYASLIDDDCLTRTGGSVTMRFGGDLYRYALADALVSARLASTNDTSFSDRLPLAHLPAPDRAAFDEEIVTIKSKRKRGELEESFAKGTVVAWLSRYGECIVRHDPVKARLWLLTPPDGPEEISRINDLRPAFSACLGNGTMTFNRVTMRGTVAINYYRLAMATRLPQVGTQ